MSLNKFNRFYHKNESTRKFDNHGPVYYVLSCIFWWISICCVFAFSFRDWVVLDFDICGSVSINQKGRVFVFKNLKGYVVTNVLDSSLDPSSYTLIESDCVWWSDLFDSLMFQIYWDLQVLRCHVSLHSISINARKSFLCLMLCSWSLWLVMAKRNSPPRLSPLKTDKTSQIK